MTVKLELLENQSLGIGFSQLESPPYCQVAKLQEKGAAKESGKIHEGDTLLSINSKDVRELSPEEVREMLQSLPKSTGVTLGLHRTAVNGGLAMENGPSIRLKPSSPETSPRMGRRRRAGVISGLADRLPDIDESTSLSAGGLHPPQDKKRYSLTPETSRKQEQPRRMPIKTAKSLDLSNLPQWRQQAMQMVPLRNVQDGSELHDRLHNQQIKVSWLLGAIFCLAFPTYHPVCKFQNLAARVAGPHLVSACGCQGSWSTLGVCLWLLHTWCLLVAAPHLVSACGCQL